MSEAKELNRRFIALALPAIAASLTVPVASLVDAAILGHLDALEPLAGVALGAVVFDMLYWSFGFLRMGTTGLTAQALGRDDPLETRALLLRAGLLALGFALVLLGAQGLIERLAFALLHGEAAVEDAARAYYRARIWAAPAVLLNFCVNGWLLGLQRTRAVLLLALVANGANVGLDLLLIVELDMGAAGAGWATTLSQYASLLAAAPVLRRAWAREGPLPAAALRERALDGGRMLALLRLGRDIWLRTLALISAFALFTSFSAAFSSVILAANALLLRVLGLTSYVVDGFAHASESLVGEASGRDDRAGLARVLKLALAWGLATGAVFAAVFIGAPQLFRLLTDQPELLATVTASRGWLVVVLLLGSLAYILDGYFIGLTAGRILARSMLLAFGLGFLPLALWARFGGGGARALWIALLAFMAARALTLGLAVPATLREPRGTLGSGSDG